MLPAEETVFQLGGQAIEAAAADVLQLGDILDVVIAERGADAHGEVAGEAVLMFKLGLPRGIVRGARLLAIAAEGADRGERDLLLAAIIDVAAVGEAEDVLAVDLVAAGIVVSVGIGARGRRVGIRGPGGADHDRAAENQQPGDKAGAPTEWLWLTRSTTSSPPILFLWRR